MTTTSTSVGTPATAAPGASPIGAARPSLHLPEEPRTWRAAWWDEVASGRPWDDLIEGEDGPAGWLWTRWQVLRAAGLEEKEFRGIVVAYRRELWLWLVGERTWRQTCSGLIGRVQRRLAMAERGSAEGPAAADPLPSGAGGTRPGR
jgi:hypothetical protein